MLSRPRAGRFWVAEVQWHGRMLQLNHPRVGRVQPALGSRRPRQPASETRLVARRTREALRCWKTLQQRSVGQDELGQMDARGGQPHQSERLQAVRPPRYNHLHLGGPVRARQARKQLNSSQNAVPAASSRSPQPLVTTAQTTPKPAPAITLQPTRDRCGMSRDCLTRRAGRRSTTTPVSISIFDDATRHERQLAKTSPSPSAQRTGVQLQAPEGARSATVGD